MRFSPAYFTSLACWLVMLFREVAGDQTNSSALKIDLVFPLNETYNPSPMLPIIFSYGDPSTIPLFEPLISYRVWNESNRSTTNTDFTLSSINYVPLVNGSSINPYIDFGFYTHHFNTEGRWSISVILRWASCYVDPEVEYESPGEWGKIHRNNTYVGTVTFTTKGPLKQVDLLAATKNQTCSSPVGININVERTAKAVWGDGFEGDTCPIVDSPTEADSCSVTLNPSAVSNIDAAMTSIHCTGPKDDAEGIDCDAWREARKNSAGLRVIAGGVTSLAFVLSLVALI
ncbi:hypothetical protein FSHL1_006570 [Fusarium sambucinum]